MRSRYEQKYDKLNQQLLIHLRTVIIEHAFFNRLFVYDGTLYFRQMYFEIPSQSTDGA